jgi:hypothetical protein
VRAAALALAALAFAGLLTACESSQEKNAQIAKVVAGEQKQRARRKALAERSLTITRPSKVVHVLAAQVLHSSEGTAAAVVTLRNSSSQALRDVPIQITVRGASGMTVYTNTTPGLASSLTSVPLIGAHMTVTWVNDQVQASPPPAGVSAKVGEGEPQGEVPPSLSITEAHLGEGGVEGSLVNHSSTAQREVVVYAIARRGSTIVAAGSALVAQVEAGTSAHFQAFLVGDARGAQLEVDAPGSTGS